MTFKLTTPAELREIQIGFCNFWPNDNEDYVEPLSVLVQAGMDLENLVNVCSLDAVTDHGYTANCSQVFGKNLRQFSSNEQVGLGGRGVRSLRTPKKPIVYSLAADQRSRWVV